MRQRLSMTLEGIANRWSHGLFQKGTDMAVVPTGHPPHNNKLNAIGAQGTDRDCPVIRLPEVHAARTV